MDAVAKELWCEALRSGEFKQGYSGLYNGCGGYCCLGVAAKIFPSLEDMARGFLPPEAIQLLDLDCQTMLAEMNDKGKTFAEIADYIEHNL